MHGTKPPFCASSWAAQFLSDELFWEHVFITEGMPERDDRGWEEAMDDEIRWHETEDGWLREVSACPSCGAIGACGWDENGLPFIHALDPDWYEAV